MYEAGDKFEIEIDRDFIDENDNRLYLIKGFRSLVFDENGLNKLEKAMSESDIMKLEDDAFRDGYRKAECEAFKQGYDAGYKDGYKFCETKHKNNANEPNTVKASELAVDTKVFCSNVLKDIADDENRRYFATLYKGKMYAFNDGKRENNHDHIVHWTYMTLEDGTVVLPE